jgi:glycosyltransferase involved in cell wall biosynthesis
MTKKRLFIANDASYLDTGYGVYGKELLTRLHNSGKYEVAELGCYGAIDNPKNKEIPWKFYPNAVNNNDERANTYKANTLNQFGLWRFNRAILDFKPHIVFDIRDYWMFAYQEMSPYKKYFNWVIMPATDSAPPKTDWMYTYANADIVVPYTRWALTTLKQYGSKKLNIFPKIANAGINPDEFYILDQKDKQNLKELYFGRRDALVTGLVMRNQKRKLICDMLIAYKKYLTALKESQLDDLYDRSILYFHTSYPEENGWDLPSLLLEFGLLDKTYFSYSCKSCNQFFPSKFQGGAKICENCKHRSSFFISPTNGVKTNILNTIYNLFDIYIQYAICEGFGMPQIEAAACGLQIASVDYSAMTEICENVHGIKIPVNRTFRELETNADRVYPDNNFTANMLYQFFVQTPDEIKHNNSVKIRESCINYYTWDNVYKVWDECFDCIDIKSKKDWNDPTFDQTNHAQLKVPDNLDSGDFIEYICRNIINEPQLTQTANMQTLIRDLDMGLVSRNGSCMILNRNHAIESLDGLLSNKVNCEKMRLNPNLLPKEDFI